MENTQAILLLTSHLTHPSDEVVKPLTPHEWGCFAFWLNERGLFPSLLLHKRLDVLLNGWIDKSVSQDRIRKLLHRRQALDLALGKWQKAGIWVLTRSDDHYPIRLKAKLKTLSPPVLFGVGNRSLLNSAGLAVVGSRKAPHEDLLFAEQLGEKAANARVTVISGAAKGIDESSMLGALVAVV